MPLCRVKWERVNVSWVDNGDYVEYSLKKTYQFVPEMSAGSEEDVLTMINIPLAVRFTDLKKMVYFSSKCKFLFVFFRPLCLA